MKPTQGSQSQKLLEKWGPVLDHKSMPAITDPQRKLDTAMLLENQAREGQLKAGMLSESGNNMGGGANAAGAQAGYDPVLISIIRRAAPQMIAYDVMGVQAMPLPTGLIFAMRGRYGPDNQSTQGLEAGFNFVDVGFSGVALGTGAQTGSPLDATLPTGTPPAGGSVTADSHYPYSQSVANPPTGPGNAGFGMTTAQAEQVGIGANAFNQMSFSFDKITVTAETRKLKASYSIELAQDLDRLHGLDAEVELSNILSREITSEVNREVLGSIYGSAVVGAQGTYTPGLFDLDRDSSGRWSVEKFKGLMFQIEREANQIYLDTRRGKGNIVICSADVASALSMAGLLDYQGLTNGKQTLDTDVGANGTFAGILNGRYKVYIDPYLNTMTGTGFGSDRHVVVVGYKGQGKFDAGKFYCPYVQLQALRGAVDPNTLQPVIGYQTRYGLADNPFAQAQLNTGVSSATGNLYYRKFLVTNLLTN